jgi:hypothetical protein
MLHLGGAGTIISGGVGERLKPAVLKTVRPERVSGVRIPPPPPDSTFLSLWSDLARKVKFGGQICGTDWTRKPFSALKANQFASFTSDFSEKLSMVPFRAYDKQVAQLTSAVREMGSRPTRTAFSSPWQEDISRLRWRSFRMITWLSAGWKVLTRLASRSDSKNLCGCL